MKNIFGFSDFVRFLKEQPAGEAFVYFVPEGKTYRQTVNSLTATAVKFQINLTTDQIMIVQAGKVTEYAVSVTRKR